MNIVSMINGVFVLKKGQSPTKIVDVGKGKLRLYIGEDTAPSMKWNRS